MPRLGEIWAWIIGWDLVLEYAMSCSVVASHWSNYFNEFIRTSSTFLGADKAHPWTVPVRFLFDPFTPQMVDGQLVQTYLNLPAMLIMGLTTIILVIGIRESATTNAVLVVVKTLVVLFVIAMGWGYVNQANWNKIPVENRRVTDTVDFVDRNPDVKKSLPPGAVTVTTTGEDLLENPTGTRQEAHACPGNRGRSAAGRSEEVGPVGSAGTQGDVGPLGQLAPQPVFAVRLVGDHGRGRARLLRLHRLRLDFDPLRRGHQPAARRADGDSCVAGHLHGPLHPDGGRDHRHGALLQDRHRGSGGRRLSPQGGRGQQPLVAGLGLADLRSGHWPA